jgi:predicted nucleotidyltransferase
MNHGLSDETVRRIAAAFSHYPEIEQAVLYGSRAKGNFRNGSDIDLTLIGEKLDSKILGQIDWELDELPLPYKIDLSIFHQLTHPELIEHIRRVGIIFYERKSAQCRL